VLRLIDEGRVVVRGGLRTIEPVAGGGFLLHLPNETIEVSHCVNCTGVGYDVADCTDPLIGQLIDSGLVRRHPFGGFELDPDTYAARPGLYIVGHHARGVRYLTSGMRFVKTMVTAVIDALPVHERLHSAGLLRSMNDRSSSARWHERPVHARHHIGTELD